MVMIKTPKLKPPKKPFKGEWKWNYELKKLEFHPRQFLSRRQLFNRKHPPNKNIQQTIPPPNHGRDIYFWLNIQNKRVVYSFTKAMENNEALRQMTFFGKKTVPGALRKDMWKLFLHVQFQTQKTGLRTFHLLREYRKRHETAYDPKILKMPIHKRMIWLMDQKANSVADLAASLDKSQDAQTKIFWDDIYDAEYAKSWPKSVKHDTIQYDPGTGLIVVREPVSGRPPTTALATSAQAVDKDAPPASSAAAPGLSVDASNEGSVNKDAAVETEDGKRTKDDQETPSASPKEQPKSWLSNLKKLLPSSLSGRRSSPRV